MLIRELTEDACLEALASTNLGRLACVQGTQPYVVPIHFAYQDYWLYSFSMPGKKIDWMRVNPSVCLEADKLRREEWTTVVVLGSYEELFDTPALRSERLLAHQLLQQRPMWWESAGASRAGGAPTGGASVFFRIRVEQVSGRYGTTDFNAEQALPKPEKRGWLNKILRRT